MRKGKEPQKAVEIPFASLLQEKVEGLLFVGKAGAGGRALGTAHVDLFQGQAAGTAAAIAAQTGSTPRKIEIAKLQSQLRAAGVMIP